MRLLLSGILLAVLVALAGASEHLQIEQHPSGLLLILDHRPDHPVTSTQIWVRTGARHEGERYHGLAHFLEHLVFRGTRDYPDGRIDDIVDGFGGYINAATSKDSTRYYIQSANEQAPLALDILADMALHPLVDTSDVQAEKPVVIEEIRRGRDNPYRQLSERLAGRLFAGHPYERNIIATPQKIQDATRELILEYHRRHYHPSNMALILSGGFDPKAVKNAIEANFSQFEHRPRPTQTATRLPAQRLAPPLRLKLPNIGSPILAIGMRGESGLSKRSLQMEFLAEILSGSTQSPLYRRLVEPGTLLGASFHASSSTSLDAAYLYASLPPGMEPDQARTLLRDELEHFRVQLLTGEADTLIRDTLSRLRAERLFARQRAAHRAGQRGQAFILGDPRLPEHQMEIFEHTSASELARLLKARVLRTTWFPVEALPADSSLPTPR